MSRLHPLSTLTSWLPTSRRTANRRARLEIIPLEDRVVPATLSIGAGTGLVGTYFSDTNLSSMVRTRTDPGVNFTWGPQ